MELRLELLLAALLVLGLGVWGVLQGVRRSRRAPQAQPLTPQQLSGLAQPYRRLLGEALAVQQDVAARAKRAPKSLEYELGTLAWRLEQLVGRALPRARRGSELAAQLLKLRPDEAQYAATQAAARAVEAELSGFVATLRTLRGKVYQVLSDADKLASDQTLAQDLDDALIDVSALEEAFSEVKLET